MNVRQGVDELRWASAADQMAAMGRGEVTSRELVEASIARIERLDPPLNAFRVVLAEEALAAAAEADARRSAGGSAPLLGVPIAIKDDTEQVGQVTMFGSGANDRPSTVDSEVLRRLEAAGAVVVGRTNACELLIWPFTESETWGVTRNPWDRSRTPGGSSGGSAVAVATGMVPVALGSDGGGSVRIPASCCGLFGLKTTRGLIPIDPHSDADHAWQGLAVYGPLARTVADAALFLDATADAGAEGSFADAARTEPGPLRIGVAMRPPLPGPVDSDVRASVARAADALRSLGHRVVEVRPRYRPAVANFFIRYFAGVARTAAALPHPERYEARTRRMAKAGDRIPAAVLRRARQRERRVAEALADTFERVDVLLTPTLAGPPVEVGRWKGHGVLRTLRGASLWTPYLAAWNVTGQPAASVPMGLDSRGLPLGVQLVGRMASERMLLSLAAQLERELPWAMLRPPDPGP